MSRGASEGFNKSPGWSRPSSQSRSISAQHRRHAGSKEDESQLVTTWPVASKPTRVKAPDWIPGLCWALGPWQITCHHASDMPLRDGQLRA